MYVVSFLSCYNKGELCMDKALHLPCLLHVKDDAGLSYRLTVLSDVLEPYRVDILVKY